MSAWNANVNIKLFSFPVQLELATKATAKSSNVSFKTVHTTCLTPVKQPKWCPTCDIPIPAEEIGKGLPKEGEIVLVSDSELDALKIEPASEINVVSFCNVYEIDPVRFDRSYYLVPSSQNERYAIFLQAMEDASVGAVCHYRRAGQEKWGFLRSLGGVIGLETLFVDEDVLLNGAVFTAPVDQELLGLANDVIESMTKPFSDTVLVYEDREAMRAMLETVGKPKKKVAKKIVVEETTLATLRASVEAVKKERKKAA